MQQNVLPMVRTPGRHSDISRPVIKLFGQSQTGPFSKPPALQAISRKQDQLA